MPLHRPPPAPKPASALAFLGEGWAHPRADRGGASVAATAICARHERHLSAQPAEARAQAVDTLAWIDDQLRRGYAVGGYVGYEIGAALEGISAGAPAASRQRGDGEPSTRLPDAALVAMEPIAIQPSAIQPSALLPSPQQVSALHPSARHVSAPPALPHDLLRQRDAYVRAVRSALAAIAAGRYYQINLTLGFDTAAPEWLRTEPLAHALAALGAAQPVPLSMAMQIGERRLFCLSMERFIAVRPENSGGKTVWSRPIKGTTRRGTTGADDRAKRAALLASEKERAENTMIVDMVRNDLTRAAALGSVAVEALLEAVPYRTLWHLESEVRAHLSGDTTAAQLLSATLPPASVTGCPKVSAMTAIAQLERRRRGPYCGALGLWWPDGHVDLAVGIRTVVQAGTRAHLDVGAGIVADSAPEAEWRETCLKASAALRGLAGPAPGLARSAAAPLEPAGSVGP